MESIKFLGIIPARGGSKGILHKNIKIIAGKPLIAWTIEAAKESKFLDQFVVSTEDSEISSIAKEYGAEVIPRPKELSTDEAPMWPVLQHVLSKIETESVVLLQPTSPVRNKGLIDSCIQKFCETEVDNLATGFMCKFFEYGTYTQNRQNLEGFFYDDGNVYVIKAALIRTGKRMGNKVEKVIISKEQNVEIDDNFDFWLAEEILLKRIKEGKITFSLIK